MILKCSMALFHHFPGHLWMPMVFPTRVPKAIQQHIYRKDNMWPDLRKPGTSRKKSFRVISVYSDQAKFLAKCWLWHEWVHRSLGYEKLKYEAWLYYHQGAISPNSRPYFRGKQVYGTCCYARTRRCYSKRQLCTHSASFLCLSLLSLPYQSLRFPEARRLDR